ncbi:MAG TPA: FCD domain-containing protein [Actinomycetota bacterium]
MRGACPDKPADTLAAHLAFPLGSAALSCGYLLAIGTANSIIGELMRQVMHALGEERRASLQVPGQIRRAIEGHRAIMEAIAAHDPTTAAQAMRQHLYDAQHYITDYIREFSPIPATGPSGNRREHERDQQFGQGGDPR